MNVQLLTNSLKRAVSENDEFAEGECTKELQDTWEEALNVVSKIMLEAANRPELFREELRLAGYDEHGFRLNKSAEESESDKKEPVLTKGANE